MIRIDTPRGTSMQADSVGYDLICKIERAMEGPEGRLPPACDPQTGERQERALP